MASTREYLSQEELEQFADITITDSTEADDQISMAEELIDQFVGFQRKFIEHTIRGMLTAGGTTSHTLQSDQLNQYDEDYFKGCYLEIIGGTGSGQRKKITASTKAGVLTTETFTNTTSTDSFYKIFQVGKFPRKCDVFHDTLNVTDKYYKSIPEAVKRATAAQVEYRINSGEGLFTSDKADMERERIGDYEYEKTVGSSKGGAGVNKLIAPKARVLLRGITNRKGTIVV
jgi:hypothetical protein